MAVEGTPRPAASARSGRRDAVAILLAVEALWFAFGVAWTLLTHDGIDGLQYPTSAWPGQVVALLAVQAASAVVVVPLAVQVRRGSNLALTATLVLAAAHIAIQVMWSLTGLLLFPYYLLMAPLPGTAPFVLAAPILLLCISARKARSLGFPPKP